MVLPLCWCRKMRFVADCIYYGIMWFVFFLIDGRYVKLLNSISCLKFEETNT